MNDQNERSSGKMTRSFMPVAIFLLKTMQNRNMRPIDEADLKKMTDDDRTYSRRCPRWKKKRMKTARKRW
ncbi:MAG: hypothetical protein ACLU80_16330 [Dorea sp.]